MPNQPEQLIPFVWQCVVDRLEFHDNIFSVLYTKPSADFSSIQLLLASETHMDLWTMRDCNC